MACAVLSTAIIYPACVLVLMLHELNCCNFIVNALIKISVKIDNCHNLLM